VIDDLNITAIYKFYCLIIVLFVLWLQDKLLSRLDDSEYININTNADEDNEVDIIHRLSNQ